MSKGSKPRPYSKKEFDRNFDRIFPKKEERKIPKPLKIEKKLPDSWLNV